MPSPSLDNAPRAKSQAASGSAEPAQLPFISVVIPVRNEEASLASVLDDLIRQDYPHDRYEILVVDGQSTDGTAAVVQRYVSLDSPRIRLFSNPGQLSSSGKNVGVRNSRGEFILFVDGHCRIPTRSLLSEHVRILRESGAECLCRPQPLSSPGNTWFQNVVAHARATLIGHGRDSDIYRTDLEGFVNPTSSGAGYRRSVFERVGLYDERFDACEDVEFNHRVYRAAIPSYFSPRLAILYEPRSSLSGLFRQMLRYGRGRFLLMQKHKETACLSQVLPAAFVSGLAFLALGYLASSLARPWSLVVLVAYAAVLLASSAALGVRHGWQDFLVAPFVYLSIHIGLGAGFWVGAFEAWRERWRHRKASAGAPAAPLRGRTAPARCGKEVVECPESEVR
jgi:GT2 family glycosyltransferase